MLKMNPGRRKSRPHSIKPGDYGYQVKKGKKMPKRTKYMEIDEVKEFLEIPDRIMAKWLRAKYFHGRAISMSDGSPRFVFHRLTVEDIKIEGYRKKLAEGKGELLIPKGKDWYDLI